MFALFRANNYSPLQKRKCVFICLSCFFLCLFPFLTFSRNLEGLALVSVKSKQIRLQNHMVIRLSSADAQFAAIDELGGIPFVVTLDEESLQIHSSEGSADLKNKAVKTFLSLPISKEAFLSVLNDEPDEEFWLHQKKKKLMISFQDFQEIPGGQKKYPRRIRIEYKKNFFELVWQHLKFLD